MQKFFKVPFAFSGDKTAVANDADPSGLVTYTEGYGPDYQRPRTDPSKRNIERDRMNQVLYDITTAMQELQVHGAPDFITTALNGGAPYSYDLGSLVRYNTDLYYSLVGTNTALPTDATKWALLPKNADQLPFVQAGTGAVIRTTQVELRDRISVKQFGAKGDGATDDFAAIQAAFTYAATLGPGATVYFPAGVYLCSARVTTTGVSVAVQGAGVSTTKIVFTTAACGFYFTLDPQSSGVAPDQLYADGFTIEARAAGSNPGLMAEWTTRQPNAQGQLWLTNLDVVRKADGTGSFPAGIRLKNCIGGWVDGVNIVGDDARTGNYGLQLENCVEIMGYRLRINRYKECVHINKVAGGDPQSEGIFINGSFLFDCNYGLRSPDDAIHINLIGTFINQNGAAAAACVDIVNGAQCTVAASLLYVGGNPGDAANQDGVRFTGRNGNKVIGTTFVGVTKANARYAILTSGGASYNSFENNPISSFSGAGFFISGGTDRGNRLINNDMFDCTLAITDSGVGTWRQGNTTTAVGGNPVPIDALRFGANTGGFAQGSIVTDSNWGMFLYPYAGAFAGVALADSAGSAVAGTGVGRFGVKQYAKASLPSAATFGNGMTGLIMVTDDVGGFTLAFSDGTNWRRVADRAIIS